MDQWAIVTGGARGIGLGIARQLKQDGYGILLLGRSEPEKVADVLKELNAGYIQMDISELEEQEKAWEKIREAYGVPDLLVNNAGVAPNVRADLMEMSPESFDRVMNINLRGPFFWTQRIAKAMMTEKKVRSDFQPRIVTITSVSAYAASVNRGEYCMSKSALSMACSLYAARLADEGIPVFEVRPGIIATDMTAAVKEKYDALIADGLLPIKRWGEPEDLGRIVSALASGKLDYAAGQVIDADGGFHIRRL